MTTNYVEILDSALKQKVTAERPLGCGRIYVAGFDKEHAKGIAAAAKRLGLQWQAKSYYGARNALYVGYDNMSGLELARGTAIVAAFRAAGINCYRDEQGD